MLETNRYMTLATADEDGTPWASPVWFAPDGHDGLLWVSDPGARHSRNIARREEIAIVVFDSHLVPGETQALYMTASAAEVTADARDRCIASFSRHSLAQGLPPWSAEDVVAPARHRLYRATIAERWVLGPGDRRIPV
jgi:nitroimidazol reductase NimA-like FMN-containing flavoprotein (pyridoxamine 5'-phosphate oxidase superfamily)